MTTTRIQQFGAHGAVGAINQIVILESLPDGERRTGRMLRDDLEPMIIPYGNNLELHYRTPGSADEFEFLLRQLWAYVAERGRAPCLQIESHGGPDGLQFADGSIMPWSKLKPLLMAINHASRMNLFLVLACCHGGWFAADCRYQELVPFAWMLGPGDKINPAPLYSLMTNFWATALRIRDVTAALNAAGALLPNVSYVSLSAVGVFRIGLAARIRKRLGSPGVDLHDEESLFDQYRTQYFALNDFPENASRFGITYAEVLEQARASDGAGF